MKWLNWLILCNLLILEPAYSQEEFKNTLFLNDTAESPKATLAEVAWIAGHWLGEAFGGTVEEVWLPPLGNSMTGAFKLVVGNEVQFYELETIAEENETLILRLKHFNADLTAWEEKDETVDFKLVRLAENKAYFEGFTFEKISDTEMNIYVVIENQGEKLETRFNYHRQDL